MPPAPLPLSGRSPRTADSPISYFIQKAIETPGLISLAAGLVDEASLPAADVGRGRRRPDGRPRGGPGRPPVRLDPGADRRCARRCCAHVCAADGVTPADLGLSVDDVVITTGSQQLLYLLGEVLFDPGDIVITEAPSYFVYHSCLRQPRGAGAARADGRRRDEPRRPGRPARPAGADRRAGAA